LIFRPLAARARRHFLLDDRLEANHLGSAQNPHMPWLKISARWRALRGFQNGAQYVARNRLVQKRARSDARIDRVGDFHGNPREQ
jgi:hypothetical protein